MQTAIVTGASRGIGRAVALGLAEEGYETALLARSEDALTELAAEIESGGKGKGIVLPVDVTKPSEVKAAVSELRKRWDRLDLFFNNAGINVRGSVEPSEDDFDRLMKTNVYGPFFLLKELVPWFRDQKSGTIINLASIAGTIGFPGVGSYCASKFALRGLSESLHRELEPEGVRVALVSPSWVDTQMAEGSPVKPEKMIQPSDILTTIRFIRDIGENVAINEIIVGCRSDIQ